jgi:hypothetical protein
MPRFTALFPVSIRSVRSTAAAVLLTAVAGCGGEANAPAAPAPSLTYSAWRITPGTAAPAGVVPAADPGNPYVGLSLSAYNDLRTYWSASRTAPRIRTFWFVPTATTISGATVQSALYLSDSLPGTGPGGAQPELIRFASPVAGGNYDDPAVNWNWTVTGSAPSNATITAQYLTNYPGAYVAQPCLGQDTAPYVYQRVSFVQSGNTGTGTITYVFRAVRASCLKPRAVQSTWQLVVPFTATRVL